MGKSKKGKSAPKYAATSSRGVSPPAGGSSSSSDSPDVITSPPSLAASTSSSSSSLIASASPDLPIEDSRMAKVVQLILDLHSYDLRGAALDQLAKEAATFPDLAPLLWFSFGTIVVLLQEVLSIYKMLSPPLVTPDQLKRVCNAIALFQCVASHPQTRILFAEARIPIYLYLFLNKMGEFRPLEHLKLSTLGVIGALLKVPDTRLVVFLLSSEIMPLCLHAVESGNEMSRTVATFVVQKLLLDDVGLSYVCYLPERLFAVCQALGNVVAYLAEKPSVRLLKHVIGCYLRLLDDQRSLWVLRITLPTRLSDGTFDHCLREDEMARIWLEELLDNVRDTLLRWCLCAVLCSCGVVSRISSPIPLLVGLSTQININACTHISLTRFLYLDL